MILQLDKIQHIEKFTREKELEENECYPPYKVKVRLRRGSREGIFIDIPLIKNDANYLNKSVNPPKDCDALIIDLDAKIVYLIELKRSKSSATPIAICEQLNAGEAWWQHISFCINIDIIEFKLYKIAVIVSGKVSRSREYPISDLGYYRVNGKNLNLDYIAN